MDQVDDQMDVQRGGDTGNTEESNLSSDDGDDEIDDSEEQSLRDVSDIEEKLLQSPYDYQSHFDLIQLLRKIGEFEKLREARTQMSKIFPLTQALWLDWIEDEKKFAESEEDHTRIHELFEKAVKDYLCPEVWLEYSQYCIRWMGSEDGLKKIRDVMERAIAAIGLHVTEGAAIWEMYREFENALLVNMQPQPGSVASAEQQEKIKKQTDKISLLFKGQLAVPLFDMENTFREYAEWCEDDIDNGTKYTYEQALKQLEEIKPLEEALIQTQPPKLEDYQNYINHEIKSGSSARIQCIYERAIVDNCLNSELWIQYLKYMSYQPNPPELLAEIHLRSVRNCPWTGQLWVSYLLALERCNSSKEKLEEVFNEALNAGFASPYEYVELWKTRCAQIRRALTAEANGPEEKTELTECFEKAISYITEKLMTVFNDSGDPNYAMWTFWARCEAGICGNLEKAREILQDLLQNNPDARRKLCIYRELCDIERTYGGEEKLDKCRSILRQAVQNCAILPDSAVGGLPDAEIACEMLVSFEREHGTLKDMDESLRRVTNKLSRIAQRREKQEAAAHGDQHKGQKKHKQWQQKQQNKKQSPRKRKSFDDSQDKGERGRPSKQQKVEKPAGSPRADEGFKAPAGLPVRYVKKAKVGQQPTEEPSPKRGPPPGFKGESPAGAKAPPPGFKGPPPGFKPSSAQPKTSDENNNKDQETKEPDKTATVQLTSDTGEIDADKKTVFISNLDYKITDLEEKLRSVFCSCGKIADIRLVKNNKGQFRGFGYIGFSEEREAEEALKLDRKTLEGRPIYVSPNVDKKKQPNFKIFKYEVGMEKHKLFVSNLSFHTTEETLKQEFSKHGPLKGLRIVTTRRGQSKGLAYVEYENEHDAAQAVIKMDGKDIDQFQIQVAISNPPSRKPSGQTTFQRGGKDAFRGGRGRGRTQLAMVPRTVHQSDKVSNGKEDSKPSTSGGMSNKDFANLLLKK